MFESRRLKAFKDNVTRALELKNAACANGLLLSWIFAASWG